VAGSVNVHGISTAAEAAVGARTVAVVPDITLDADSTLRTVSAAGASAQAAPSAGLGAFGAALDLGTLRIRERGSHGGHNGLRSLIEVLDSDEFARVRVGIRKGEPQEDLAEYVLSEFPEEDVLIVQEMVGLAGDAVECLRERRAEAMNRFNGARKEPG
jgi:hypothetical protein